MENRQAGILPPALGEGNMLNLTDLTGIEQLDPLTRFKLFEREDATGPSNSSIPLAPSTNNQATSRKQLRISDDGNSNSGCGATHTADRLPQPFASAALKNAISQVTIQMEGWGSLHILRLFIVLVDPPQDLIISDIQGFHDYLTDLLVELGGLVENGVCGITSHCWCALLGKCSAPNFSLI